MDKQKIYFPNLNGIRFIAAFLVIIHHLEHIKFMNGFQSYWEVPFISVIGKLGVVLFFVLSGFLITYLLLSEESKFQTISIKKFYIRRLLRIWPLYFTILILAFAVLPNIDSLILKGFSREVIYENLGFKLFLYVIFLPNLSLALLGIVPYVSHTWSIGTEEQFYLVWPVLIKYVRKRRIELMIFIILFYMIINYILKYDFETNYRYQYILLKFWNTFNIDCMAIGGIFAIILFEKKTILDVLKSKLVFYITLITTIVLIFFGIHFSYLHSEIYATLFGIIILNYATNSNIPFSLENKTLNYLGNISYGLYMYHPISIGISILIAKNLNLINNWFLYPVTIGLTIIFAALSYKYLESFFLKFKSKYSKIVSGNIPAQ